MIGKYLSSNKDSDTFFIVLMLDGMFGNGYLLDHSDICFRVCIPDSMGISSLISVRKNCGEAWINLNHNDI